MLFCSPLPPTSVRILSFLMDILCEVYSLKNKLEMDFDIISPITEVILMSQMHLLQPSQTRGREANE